LIGTSTLAFASACRSSASALPENATESPRLRSASVGLWKPTEFSAPMKMLR
jgi:hypothetical protein